MLVFPFLYSNPLMVANSAWYHDYDVIPSVRYVDNFRLTETDQIDTRSSALDLMLEIGDASETTTVTGIVRANATDYSDSSIEDTDSYQLVLDIGRLDSRFYQLLLISQTSESTTQTELLDTGRIVDGARITSRIWPELGYAIDERNLIVTSLDHRDFRYDRVSLVDYTEDSLSLSWNYQMDETSSLSSSVSVSEFDPQNDSATDIIAIGVSYGSGFSSTTAYNLGIGFSKVDRPSDSETGSNFSFGVSYNLDSRNGFEGSLSKGFEGSGSGNVRESNRLDFKWTHQLSERLVFDLSSDAVSDDFRDYISIVAGSNFDLKRYESGKWWEIKSSIEYRKQNTINETAESFGIFIALKLSLQPEFELKRDQRGVWRTNSAR